MISYDHYWIIIIMTILSTLDKKDMLVIFDIAKKYFIENAIKDDDSKVLIVKSYIYAIENVLNSKDQNETN